MTQDRTRIQGGRILVAGELVAADLVVEGERIAAIVARDEPVTDARELDATGRVILPGIIDLHAHTREPGYTHKEDYFTASRAAAAGRPATRKLLATAPPWARWRRWRWRWWRCGYRVLRRLSRRIRGEGDIPHRTEDSAGDHNHMEGD